MSTALEDLCQRREPITADEAEILGARKLAELAARREQLISERWSRRYERHLADISLPFAATQELDPSVTGVGVKWYYQSITAMPAYSKLSFEVSLFYRVYPIILSITPIRRNSEPKITPLVA